VDNRGTVLAAHVRSIAVATDRSSTGDQAVAQADRTFGHLHHLEQRETRALRSMELIEDYRHTGQGQGGWRPDKLYYGRIAPI